MLEEGYLRQGTAAALLAQLYFNAEVYTGESRFAECAQICQDLLDGKYGYYELEEDWFGPFTCLLYTSNFYLGIFQTILCSRFYCNVSK